MKDKTQIDAAANAAAEDILQLIYGPDLRGCAVRVDDIAAVIRKAFEQTVGRSGDLTELHLKGFEAVQLLSTPPIDGSTLSPEDLRSLLGERLDKIRELSSKILAATGVHADETSQSETDAPPPRF